MIIDVICNDLINLILRLIVNCICLLGKAYFEIISKSKDFEIISKYSGADFPGNPGPSCDQI